MLVYLASKKVYTFLMIAGKEANTDAEAKLFRKKKKKLETRLGANIKQAMISLQRMAAERLHRNYYFLFFSRSYLMILLLVCFLLINLDKV